MCKGLNLRTESGPAHFWMHWSNNDLLAYVGAQFDRNSSGSDQPGLDESVCSLAFEVERGQDGALQVGVRECLS